jgi:hypothetical protein
MKLLFAGDNASERATDIHDYQYTCCNFITDISNDYKDWVDRYQLPPDESKRRKDLILEFVNTTNNWIEKYGNTIRKVDIIMNDGVSKMAETTAGYPFKFETSVNNMKRYTEITKGNIKVRIVVMPRQGRRARIGRYSKQEMILKSCNSDIAYKISSESLNTVDFIDDYLLFDASECGKGDVLSFTVIAEELSEELASESRGYTTLVLIV